MESHKNNRRAIISVSDKTKIVELACELEKLGFDIISTGGTAETLRKADIKVIPVSEYTQCSELLGGRVKTLHPVIHAGILADRNNPEHMQDLCTYDIDPIQIVVCNLYPFIETYKKENAKEEEIIEQIDIGGVTLIRSAAKNFAHVTVIVDPNDYDTLIRKLQKQDKKQLQISLKRRQAWAYKAFSYVALYDNHIAKWFARGDEDSKHNLQPVINVAGERLLKLRYGENPHQQGSLYGNTLPFEKLSGKELSYNNLLDVEVACNVVDDFSDPCVCIVKHSTPCGIAIAADIAMAYIFALASDPISAFGSIIAVNREVTIEFLNNLGALFVEVLVAPSYTPESRKWLASKKKNCRVLRLRRKSPDEGPAHIIRNFMNGYLLQTPDLKGRDSSNWRVVTQKQPSEEQMAALRFAWLACKHVKSNAIVLAQGSTTVGIGTGQPNRVDSVIQAASRAKNKAIGSVLASDAFFPFPDGIVEASQVGVVAIVQPGGSIKDKEIIEVADKLKMIMIFTDERHFKH
jgi:phosphoribosylaminoimidazolecarboxamide formyltransferase/IMP cyclohydrolase